MLHRRSQRQSTRAQCPSLLVSNSYRCNISRTSPNRVWASLAASWLADCRVALSGHVTRGQSHRVRRPGDLGHGITFEVRPASKGGSAGLFDHFQPYAEVAAGVGCHCRCCRSLTQLNWLCQEDFMQPPPESDAFIDDWQHTRDSVICAQPTPRAEKSHAQSSCSSWQPQVTSLRRVRNVYL